MSVRKIILVLFCILLNARMLTELPRVFRELHWATIQVSDYDFNRAASSAILFFCILFIIFKRNIAHPKSLPVITFILAFFVIYSIPIALSTYSEVGMSPVGIVVVLSRFFLEYVFLVFIYNFIKDKADLSILINFYFKPALIIMIAITFIQIFTSSFGEVQGVERLMGTFGSPNVLASFLHLYIFLLLYYTPRKGLVFWALLGTLYVLLFFTGSITNLGANIVFMTLVGIHQNWFRKRLFYVAFPLLSTLVVSSIIYKWEAISRRLSTLLDLERFELAHASSISWRLEAWDNYVSLLEGNILHWIFGMGVSTQRFILLHGYAHNLSYKFEAPGTHNDYLAILVDFGLLGLCFFIGLLVFIYRKIKLIEKTNPKAFYFRYYFISILVIMLTENCIDQLVTFVFLIALITLVKQQSTQHAEAHIG